MSRETLRAPSCQEKYRQADSLQTAFDEPTHRPPVSLGLDSMGSSPCSTTLPLGRRD